MTRVIDPEADDQQLTSPVGNTQEWNMQSDKPGAGFKGNVTTFKGRLVAGFNDPRQSFGGKAVPYTLEWWYGFLGLQELEDWEVYRASIVEFFATMTFYSCLIGILTTATQGGYSNPGVFAAIGVGLVLTLLIFAFANSSGAHLNPLITIGTMFARLTPFARGALYMAAQTLGAMVSGWIWREIERHNDTHLEFGKCKNDFTPFTGFVVEAIFDLVILYVAFGAAFDRSQAALYGPIAGPIMIGAVFTAVIWLTSGLGAHGFWWGGNPALCTGAAAATAVWESVWEAWFGAVLASIINAYLYVYIPPNHKAVYEERKTMQMEQQLGL